MPIVKISDFLTRVKKSIDIKDDEHYKRITIKINHLGVLLRDIQKGHLIGTKKQFTVSKGQFILSKIDAMNGAFGIVSDDLDNAIITGNFWTFDFDENKVNLDWFNLFTSSNEFVEICKKASSGTTHRKYLDEKKFNNYELELPDKKTQVEVVEKIKSIVVYQEKVKNEIEKQIQTVSGLKQSILEDAIQGKLIPQDPNDEPAEKLLEKIKIEKEKLVKEGKLKKEKPLSSILPEEIPFEIPKGWIWCKLADIGSWGAGSTPNRGNIEYYTNGTIPWIKTGELNDGIVSSSEEMITEEALKKTSLRLCKPGDVLIAMYGATIGKLALLNISATTNQACCACSPYEGVNNKYLFYFLKSQRTNLKNMGFGGAQPNISKEKLVNIMVALPPKEEQKRIVTKIEYLMKICDEQEKNIAEAKENINKLNQAILREMFN